VMLFWVVISCGLIGRYQRFGEIYYLHTVSQPRMISSLLWKPQISHSTIVFALEEWSMYRATCIELDRIKLPVFMLLCELC
jgi:hypothetical protein